MSRLFKFVFLIVLSSSLAYGQSTTFSEFCFSFIDSLSGVQRRLPEGFTTRIQYEAALALYLNGNKPMAPRDLTNAVREQFPHGIGFNFFSELADMREAGLLTSISKPSFIPDVPMPFYYLTPSGIWRVKGQGPSIEISVFRERPLYQNIIRILFERSLSQKDLVNTLETNQFRIRRALSVLYKHGILREDKSVHPSLYRLTERGEQAWEIWLASGKEDQRRES